MKVIFLIISSAILVFAGAALAQGTSGEYEMKQVLERNAGFVFPADVDGDKTDELVVLDDGGYRGSVSIINQQCHYIAQHRYGSGASLSAVSCALTGKNGRDVIFLTYRIEDSLFLSIIGGEKGWQKKVFLQKRQLIKGHTYPEWSGAFAPYFLCDANGDGSEDLIGLWITGVASHPRGVAAYDLKTGREIWYFKTGAYLYRKYSTIKDIDGDGKPEIILGTAATANGADYNGSNDFKTYVIVIDMRGKLVWKRAFGGMFEVMRAVHAFEKNGRTLLLCQTKNTGKYEGRPDRLLLLDAKDGKTVRSVEYGKQGLASVPVDMNNTGDMQLVTGNTDGRIRVYSQDLELTSEYLHAEDVGVGVMGVDDYNKDGYGEIVAFAADNTFLVLNHRMKLIYSGSQPYVDDQEYFSTINNEAGERIGAYINHGPGNNTFVLSRLARKPIIARSGMLFLSTICALSVALLTALSIIILFGIKSNVFAGALGEIHDIGIIIAGHSGAIVYINDWAKKALSISDRKLKGRKVAELFGEKLEPDCDFRTNFGTGEGKSIRVRCREISHGMAVFITDETRHDHCRRIASWAPVAQEMAHGIKTPLTTILLAAQKISSVCSELAQKDNILKYSRSIEEEADRLHNIADGFMRFVQSEALKRESVEMLPYLQGLVEEKRGMMPEGAVIALRAEDDLPRIWIDRQQMKTALGNILDNAADAVKDGGRIEVAAGLAERIKAEHVEKGVEIRIIDNGCGIKSTYMRQLFKPFASFRPGGTGLGLVFSKKIIEEHGGTIDVQSKEDHGTTATIFLQGTQREE